MQYQEVQAEVAALFACLDASRTLTQAQRCFYLCKCSTLLMSIMLEHGLAADGFIEELFFAGDKIPESPERLKRGILAALNVIREDMFRVYSEKNHGISLKAAEYIKEHYGLSLIHICYDTSRISRHGALRTGESNERQPPNTHGK